MRRHHFAAGLIALMATAAVAHAGESATIVERGSNNYASMVIHHDGGRMRMTTTIRAGASGTASTRFTMGSHAGGQRPATRASVTQQGAGCSTGQATPKLDGLFRNSVLRGQPLQCA